MRLLVSVRSAAEVASAVAGGADIVDAKEPDRGALGAVSGPVLRAIAARVPAALPLSVALGDPEDAGGLAEADGRARSARFEAGPSLYEDRALGRGHPGRSASSGRRSERRPA